MALLSGFNTLDANSSTFSDWLDKTNELILLTQGETSGAQTSFMTANSLVGGSMTYGNATLFGQFTSNTMVVLNNGQDDGTDHVNGFSNVEFGGLRGGRWEGSTNTIISDTLYIISDTTFTDESTEVYVNSTYGLIVENNIEARYDVLYVGDGPAGTNTNPQLHWQSSNNQLNFNEDVRATFGQASGTEVFGGTGQLEMFYSSADNKMLANTDDFDIRSTANLNLITDVFEMRTDNNGQLMLTANTGEGVELYWGGSLKLSTNTNGIIVHGDAYIRDDIIINDNQKLLFGDTYANSVNDETIGTHNFQLYTDGTDGFIVSGQTDGGIKMRVDTDFELQNEAGDVNYITANTLGQDEVILYANNIKRLEVVDGTQGNNSVDGVEIFGEANTTTLRVRSDANFDNETLNSNSVHWDATLEVWNYRDNVNVTFGDSDDWQMYYDVGNRAYSNTNNMDIRAVASMNVITDIFELKSDNGSELYMSVDVADNSTVRLYYEGVERLQTNTYGVEVTGQLVANGGIVVYNDQSIEMGGADYANAHNFTIVTDGTDTTLTETTRDVYFKVADNFIIQDDQGLVNLFVANTSGEVTLYYNNDEKLQTTSYGVEVTGEANTGTIRVRGDAYFDGSGALNSNKLVWEANNEVLNFENNVKATFGTNDNLQIHFDGANSMIQDAGAGSLVIEGTDLHLRAADNSPYLVGTDNAHVKLYSPVDGNEQARIDDDGVHINNEANTGTLTVRNTSLFQNNITIESATGSVTWTKSTSTLNFDDNNFATFGTSGDLSIYHSGSHSYVQNTLGELFIQGDGITLRSFTDTENYLTADLNGAVTLYHDNVIKLTTDTNGIIANGTVFADGLDMGNNDIIALGDNDNFTIFTNDAGESILRETGAGSMLLQANNLILEDTDGNDYLFGTAGGAVSLTYAGTTKFATTSGGIDVDGTAVTNGLQVDGLSDLNGNVDLGAGTGSTISFIGRVDTTINPNANNSHDLGSDALRWNNLWLGGTGTIDILVAESDATFESNVAIQDSLSVTNSVDATSFSGSGASLTSLNASNISSGTINDARLPNQITSDITGTAAQANTLYITNVNIAQNNNWQIPFVDRDNTTNNYYDAYGDNTFYYNPSNRELTVSNLTVTAGASLPAGIAFSNTTIFESIEVANTATIYNLEVTSLEANGVAFTGTGEDATTTTTVIDSFDVGQTKGFKYLVHGENLNDSASAYMVEIICAVDAAGSNIYYTRYGEIENNMADVTLVPTINTAPSIDQIELVATCSSIGADTYRFKVLKIETRT